MTTMQLAAFLAVAETLNFARAAERLHVTQPAVTQQIHSLEAELNVRLFRRTTRTVELTQEGLMFLGDAKLMLEVYERAKKRADSAAVDTREPFLIGCHSSADILHLAHTLEGMKDRFPNVYPIFRVIPFEHLYQRLSEEAVDVVLAFREGGRSKGVHYQELVRIPVVGIVSAGAGPIPGEGLLLSDLARRPLIALEPQRCPEEYRKLLHRAMENRTPMDVYFCEGIESALTLARAGYGVAMLPDFLPEREEGMAYLPILDAQPMSYGVYYKTLSGRPLRQAFVRLARESFAWNDRN